MKLIKTFLIATCVSIIFCTSVLSQSPTSQDTSFINNLLDESKKHIGDDTAKALSLAHRAFDFSAKINYPTGQAYALKNLGLVYYGQGKFVETLNFWNQSLKIFEDIKDDIGTSNILNNIGAIYFNQGVDDKALEYCLKSLAIAEKTKDKLRILSALTTIGAIYYNKKDPVAIKYLLQALPICLETDNKSSYVVIAGNLGEIYFDNNNSAKALEYFQKAIASKTSDDNVAFAYNGIGKIYLKKGNNDLALKNHRKALAISVKADDKLQIIRSYRGEGDVFAKQNDFVQALEDYKKATLLAEELQANVELQDLYQLTSQVYSKMGDFESAYNYKSKYANVKDTLYNLETAKKLGKVQFDFDLLKKEGEITLLTKEKSLKEAEVKRAQQARTALTIGLILILIIAFIIFANYLSKAKTNKILDKQKDEIEGLLLNILPEQIAYELKTQGVAKPRHYENVSVLFTDFKSFTSIADKLLPTDLVEELNVCFMQFDNIIERYDLEKIKTIGDSYMCCGNLPSPDPNHAYKIVKAGLEIKTFIDGMNLQRREKGLEPWEIRIGIHIGPVVAGVVGRKKYAYDIWGSTVNIASRMESNGSIDRVNISSNTYEAVKEHFECSHRGKIYAKNLGDIDMYFVEYEKKTRTHHKVEDTSDVELK